jgi:hypothetical protein
MNSQFSLRCDPKTSRCDPKTSGFTFYLQPLKEAVRLWIEAVP